MSNGGISIQIVHLDDQSVVLAACGVARPCTEESVDHRSVGVEDDGQRLVDGRWPYIYRLRELPRRASRSVPPAYVFVQGAYISELESGSWRGTPQRSCSIHDGGRLVKRDRAIQRTLVNVIVQPPASPGGWPTNHAGIKILRSSDIFWPTRKCVSRS